MSLLLLNATRFFGQQRYRQTHRQLILGIPAWDIGELQEDWDRVIPIGLMANEGCEIHKVFLDLFHIRFRLFSE